MLYSNTSQSRLNFDIEKLRLLGVNEIFAFPVKVKVSADERVKIDNIEIDGLDIGRFDL